MEVALSDNVINNDSKFNNKPSGFVQTEDTPNPNTIKFFPAGGKVLKEGIEEYTSKDEACESDLAYHLFSIENVDRVFLTTTFVSITKKEESSWDSIKVDIIAAIGGYFASIPDGVISGQKKLVEKEEEFEEKDKATVEMIKNLIETKIRPAVMSDGGDIQFSGYKNNVVYLQLRGACSGCPSSSYTLKEGIQNMLQHYIPEIDSVEAVV